MPEGSRTERIGLQALFNRQGQGRRKPKKKRELLAKTNAWMQRKINPTTECTDSVQRHETQNNDKHRLKSSKKRRSNTSVNRVNHTGRGHSRHNYYWIYKIWRCHYHAIDMWAIILWHNFCITPKLLLILLIIWILINVKMGALNLQVIDFGSKGGWICK